MPPEVVEKTEVKAPIGAIEGRPGVTVVTQENFNEYVNQELGAPAGVKVESENEDPEAVAKAELEALEAKQAADAAKAAEPKEGDTKGNEVFFRGKWTDKHNFQYRLHIKTEEAKAELQAKIDAKDAEAKKAREEAEAAARERDELRAKYEPPKSNELGPKPDPTKYTDIAAYSDALEAWAIDKARIETAKANEEAAAKAQQEKTAKNWSDRQKQVQAEIPDYAETIANATEVKVSDQMRDAIIESEVGPQILYHFAKHPDEAAEMSKLSVRQMLVRMGKLEAKLGSAEKPPAKSETRSVAEISKAPEPVTPLRGAGNPGTGLKIDAQGNWTGTPEEFKAARLSGKLK